MSSLLLFALLCPEMKWVNLTKEPWNEHDKKIAEINKDRCVLYYPSTPCLKEFHKLGTKIYFVLCGREE